MTVTAWKASDMCKILSQTAQGVGHSSLDWGNPKGNQAVFLSSVNPKNRFFRRCIFATAISMVVGQDRRTVLVEEMGVDLWESSPLPTNIRVESHCIALERLNAYREVLWPFLVSLLAIGSLLHSAIHVRIRLL